MGHSYEKSVKTAYKIISILAVITVCEVLFALLGKGYLIEGFEFAGWIIAGVMIIMSIVKAYLIIYEFMHMKYEVPGMVKSVLLPVGLLVWAIIAFFYEGTDWVARRNLINDKNNETIETKAKPMQQGMVKEIQTKKH